MQQVTYRGIAALHLEHPLPQLLQLGDADSVAANVCLACGLSSRSQRLEDAGTERQSCALGHVGVDLDDQLEFALAQRLQGETIPGDGSICANLWVVYKKGSKGLVRYRWL